MLFPLFFWPLWVVDKNNTSSGLGVGGDIDISIGILPKLFGPGLISFGYAEMEIIPIDDALNLSSCMILGLTTHRVPELPIEIQCSPTF